MSYQKKDLYLFDFINLNIFNIIMELNILSWNINFIHDNWYSRLKNINKIIKKESENCHIIALQEATIPFSIKNNVYNNFKNFNYHSHPLFERTFIYKYIKNNFPKYELLFNNIFNFIMDKLFFLYSYIFSNYGEFLKDTYFNRPIFFATLIFCFPFLAMGMIFIGLVTISNNKINGLTKMKHIGHFAMMQYKEFKFNNKDIFYVNLHLNPGDIEEKMCGHEKRLIEIKNVLNYVKEKKAKNIIIVGDFNDTPESEIYRVMKDNGYTSVNYYVNKKELETFPNKKRCIDYIWIKGEDIEINSFEIFGTEKYSDHFGLKASLKIL